jgi:hypothetical protein
MDCIYHLNIEYIQQLTGDGEDSDAEEMPDGEFAVTSDYKSHQSRWYSSTALPRNPNGARFGKCHFARAGYCHGMRSQRGNNAAVGCSDYAIALPSLSLLNTPHQDFIPISFVLLLSTKA